LEKERNVLRGRILQLEKIVQLKDNKLEESAENFQREREEFQLQIFRLQQQIEDFKLKDKSERPRKRFERRRSRLINLKGNFREKSRYIDTRLRSQTVSDSKIQQLEQNNRENSKNLVDVLQQQVRSLIEQRDSREILLQEFIEFRDFVEVELERRETEYEENMVNLETELKEVEMEMYHMGQDLLATKEEVKQRDGNIIGLQVNFIPTRELFFKCLF
jgi:hypothetical protein